MVAGCYCGLGYWCPAHPHIPPFDFKSATTGSPTGSLVTNTAQPSSVSGSSVPLTYSSAAQLALPPSSQGGATGSYSSFTPHSAYQGSLKRSSTGAPTPSSRKRVRTQKDTTPTTNFTSSISSRATTLRQIEVAQRAAASVPQLYHVDDEVETAQRRMQAARAIDCWYFYVGADRREEPSMEEKARLQVADQARAQGLAPLDLRKPYDPCLRCTECLKNNKWRTWKNNNEGGSASRLRRHLYNEHYSAYVVACDKIGYKIDTKRDPNADSDDIHEPITAEGILRRITEWFAEDDISFNMVSHRGFRRFFSYIGQGKVTTKDIPDRHAISLKAQKLSDEAKEKLKKEIKHARGKISCTSDLWTDEIQRAFMSITVHFVNKHRRMVHRLIGFRVIEGNHSGAHLAETFFEVVEEFGFTNKLGMITLDNASNNDTFMAQLETYMTERGLDFDREGNRLRCFPHVINIAVQAILAALRESAELFRHYLRKSGETISIELETYLLALESEPHNRIRKTAVALRRTQRRQGLRKTIREGNEQRIWRTHKLATSRYIASDPTLAEFAITHTDYEVLSDTLDVLDLAHRTQELLSSDQTPTLSLALPLYHALIDQWRELQAKRPVLSHAIAAGIDKLEAYLAKTQSSPAHIVVLENKRRKVDDTFMRGFLFRFCSEYIASD
ncbi:hAT family dimerization protein [Ceratobasidium sp. AG-Ba]|nr:hAT family dimerization protein [Ceratobasidium sp. AG-Ba]